VVTHADLRRTARIKAFLDFIGEAIRTDRDLLEGRRPQPSTSARLTSMPAVAPQM
jgi:hypothetical protein